MSLRGRVAIVAVLAVLLVGSFVHYPVGADARQPYPGPNDLAADYGAHVGERTLLFGSVLETGDDTYHIEVSSDRGPIEFRATGVEADVDPGGIVQVYGTLGANHTIAAENVVVVNPDGGGNLYKYGVSAVAAVLILAFFFRYWTVDTDARAFEVRDDG